MTYIPPGPLTGILGGMGSGKTFISIILATEIAEAMRFDLRFNFAINAIPLYYYLVNNGYTWLLSRLLRGGIDVKSCADGEELTLMEFMNKPKTLYVCDEAGAVYLNSRNFKKIPLDFLAGLSQSRKGQKRLFWIAQYKDQADKTIRELSASYVYCNCSSRPNPKVGFSECTGKNYQMFTAQNYQVFERKVLQGAVTGIKAKFTASKLAEKTITGNLSEVDKLAFAAYNSFSRVEDSPRLIGIDKLLNWNKSAINVTENVDSKGLIKFNREVWRRVCSLEAWGAERLPYAGACRRQGSGATKRGVGR